MWFTLDQHCQRENPLARQEVVEQSQVVFFHHITPVAVAMRIVPRTGDGDPVLKPREILPVYHRGMRHRIGLALIAAGFLVALTSAADESPLTVRIRVLNEEADCPGSMEFGLNNLISGCLPAGFDAGCKMTEDGRGFDLDLRKIARFHDLGEPAGELKLLLLCRGFRTERRELPIAEVGILTVWEVELTELPRWTVRGTVVMDDGGPVGGALLEVFYSFLESMPYFGYIDGPVAETKLGEITTSETGEFEVTVPDLRDDPWVDSDRRVSLVRIGPPRQDEAGWDERVLSGRLRLSELYAPGAVQIVLKRRR